MPLAEGGSWGEIGGSTAIYCRAAAQDRVAFNSGGCFELRERGPLIGGLGIELGLVG